MKTNNCKSWSEGLRLISWWKIGLITMVLIDHHTWPGLKLNTDVKVGLSSPLLSVEAVEKFTTKQEFEEILQSVVLIKKRIMFPIKRYLHLCILPVTYRLEWVAYVENGMFDHFLCNTVVFVFRYMWHYDAAVLRASNHITGEYIII